MYKSENISSLSPQTTLGLFNSLAVIHRATNFAFYLGRHGVLNRLPAVAMRSNIPTFAEI